MSAAASYDGSLQSMVALKRMTSELVGRFVTASVAGTRAAARAAWASSSEAEGMFGPKQPIDRALGRYEADLAVPAGILAEVTMLKTIAVLYVMDLPRHVRRQDRERDRLFRVAEYLKEGAPGALDPVYRWMYDQAESDAGRLRVIVDQIASMTESRVEKLDRGIAGVSAAWG